MRLPLLMRPPILVSARASTRCPSRPLAPLALAVLGALVVVAHPSARQESRFAKDKPGAWKIESRIRPCENRVDVAAFTRNVTGVAEWFHQNDAVVALPKGFDALVSLRGDGCPTVEPSGPEFHGTRGAINIAFLYFYLEQGVVKTATAWSAHDTEVHINDPAYYVGHRFDEHGWEPGDNPALREPLEKALQHLRQYFTSSTVQKTIAPGVDLYRDGTIVVSDPNRPPFWIPVTMREVMEASLAYYEVRKQIDAEHAARQREAIAKLGVKVNPADTLMSVYDAMSRHYASLTPAELDRPAFAGNGEDGTFYGSKAQGNQVVRFNPESWDRRLPRSAIQFVTLRHVPQSEGGLKEYIVLNGGLSNYVGLFYNALPVERLGALIGRQ